MSPAAFFVSFLLDLFFLIKIFTACFFGGCTQREEEKRRNSNTKDTEGPEPGRDTAALLWMKEGEKANCQKMLPQGTNPFRRCRRRAIRGRSTCFLFSLFYSLCADWERPTGGRRPNGQSVTRKESHKFVPVTHIAQHLSFSTSLALAHLFATTRPEKKEKGTLFSSSFRKRKRL